jgi:hypothetical protein
MPSPRLARRSAAGRVEKMGRMGADPKPSLAQRGSPGMKTYPVRARGVGWRAVPWCAHSVEGCACSIEARPRSLRCGADPLASSAPPARRGPLSQ